jgi:hypothetical protein
MWSDAKGEFCPLYCLEINYTPKIVKKAVVEQKNEENKDLSVVKQEISSNQLKLN